MIIEVKYICAPFLNINKHYAYFNIVMPQSLFSSMTNAAGFQLYGGAVITVLSSKTSQVGNLDFSFRKQELNLYLSTQNTKNFFSTVILIIMQRPHIKSIA